MTPHELSEELRHGESDRLSRRRHAATSALACSGIMGLISLYQLGVIRRLPGPVTHHLNAGLLAGSDQAYSIFSTPDAFLGVLSYGTTAALAAMGPQSRTDDTPWIPLAQAAKATVDAAFAAKLVRDQFTRYDRTFCLWCLTTAALTFATLALSLPEAVEALRRPQQPK